ncbi:MAG: hypothetical protein II919_02870 [Lachnospiraceae bacterium]|nr:hypothetical protein [Lachnospiraceae bacterium]
MSSSDTVYLLKECNSGTKMAVSSIDEVLDKVNDKQMKSILEESKSHHEKLCDEIHSLLSENHSEEKDPNPIAKGMSWVKTNVKLVMDNNDKTIADLMIDGCNMGIKSLNKYLNQYQNADHVSKSICEKLITIEEKLCRDLKVYL